MANKTILGKTAMGTLNEFISSPVAVETIQSTIVFSKRENGASAVPMDSADWTKEVYRVLFRRYKNWEIAYDNVSDFLDALWERIEIYAPNYFERKHRYEQYLSMSDKDLLSQGSNITNLVNHTNETVENVEEPLAQITDQTATFVNGDKVGRLREQIRSLQVAVLNDFLSRFKTLFLSIGSYTQYFG